MSKQNDIAQKTDVAQKNDTSQQMPAEQLVSGRVGDYESFFANMRKESIAYRHPDGKFEGQNPLTHTDLTDRKNFLNGMYRSWAAVLEVLSFYQDRIAQEGYLASATEQFSVDQLVSSLGFQRQFGLSATTWLAFTLQDKSQREQYLIPKGTQAQNIPQGGRPAVFETIENKMGKPQWNQLSLYDEVHIAPAAQLSSSASFCHIKQPGKPIKPKTHLWICGQYQQQSYDYLVVISEVYKRKDGSMLLFWGHALDPLKDSKLLSSVAVTWMPQQIKLFGHDIPDWQKVPAADKKKQAKTIAALGELNIASGHWSELHNAPDMHINSLLELTDGQLLAGGDKGLWQSFNNGLSWHKVQDKLAQGNVICLLQHEQVLYAAGSHGVVICSYDAGLTWTQIRGNKPLDKEDKKHISPGLLPALTINTMVAIELEYKNGGARRVLLLGTSKGLFYSVDEGHYWQEGEQLFFYDKTAMPHNSIVHHLQVAGSEVTASTSHGLYHAVIDHSSLNEKKGEEIKAKGPSFLSRHFSFESSEKKHISKENVDTDVFASLHVSTDKGPVTVFATAEHIYQIIDDKWLPFSQGLLRDEKDKIPQVNGFLVADNDLLALTSHGVYLTHELGTEWHLKTTTQVWQVADPNVWQQQLNQQQIPPDLPRNLEAFGLPLSPDVTVQAFSGASSKASAWKLTAPGCQDILLRAADGGINIQLEADGATTPGHIPAVYHYVEPLLDAELIPDSWLALFAQMDIQVSAKTKVISQDYGRRWWFIDKQNQLNFVVQYSSEQVSLEASIEDANSHPSLTISLLHGANTGVVDDSQQVLLGSDKMVITPARWPHFALPPHSLPLAVKSSSIHEHTDIFLQQSSPRQILKKVEVEEWVTEPVTEFGKSAVVTELSVLQDVSVFDRRSAVVFAGNMPCQTIPLETRSHQPQRQGHFVLAIPPPAFPTGHTLAITGQRGVLQFSTANQHGEPDTLFAWHADGRKKPLTRLTLFDFAPKSDELLLSLRKTAFCAELMKAFDSKKIPLSDDASLVAVNENCWLIGQAGIESYYLMHNEKDNKFSVLREYYLPVVEEKDDAWVVIVSQQKLLIKKAELEAVGCEILWLAADTETPAISEVASVSEFHEHADSKTSLVFTQPLKHLYDPSTIKILGNLVPAVHGESVRDEIIGSISQGKPLQSFTLRRKPLSVWQDANGQQQTSLEVKIRRNPVGEGRKPVYENWQQTDSLLHSAKNARHYQTQVDRNGQTEILFGDGTHGSIPHQGVENVVVSYMFGGGKSGNLPVGAIKMLRGKPLGVSAVINPVEATGGAEPELPASVRQAAPASLRYNDVIVSQQDCLTFAAHYPGVTQVIMQQPKETGHKVWWLCIDTNLSNKAAQKALCKELSAAVMNKLSHPLTVKVVLANRVNFSLSARVWLHKPEQWDALAPELKNRLADSIQTSRSNLGKPVDAAHLTALLQQYNEVLAAQVTGLSVASEHEEGDFLLKDVETIPARQIHTNSQGETQGADLLLTTAPRISLSLEGVS